MVSDQVCPEKESAPAFSIRESDGVYCTRSAAAGLDILLNSAFGQIRLPEYYRRLANELGRDFPDIRFVLRYLPTMHDGPHHRLLRKRAAEFLRGRASALAMLQTEAVALVEEGLRREGRMDVIAEIIEPLFGLTAGAVSGLAHMPGPMRIFTANNSLKVTRDLEADFSRLRQMARARFPDDDDDTHGIRVAFAVLGVEPLGAGLAASFARLFAGADGAYIRDLDWGETFLATGLEVIGRESPGGPVNLGPGAESVQVCEVDLGRFLQEGRTPHYIFGAGAHACLGRNIALSVWSGIGAALAANPLRVRHIATAPCTHKILNFPSALQIEVFP